MSRPAGGWTDAVLDAARQRADPIAHDVVATMFDQGADRIHAANRILVDVPPNGQLPDFSGAPDDLAQTLTTYLTQTAPLPSWAERDRIRRAEEIFFDHGLLSTLALFNASLPECYVAPTIAEVLHISGQLLDRAEYRIRSTARMIIPVMAHGGLTSPDAFGIAHLQRVRLIHGTIRHLILVGKGATEEMEVAAVRRTPGSAFAGAVMPHDVQEAMRAAGWNAETDGAPINQEEMAYTLLTFSYVVIRALRRLGVRLSTRDEEDYLHCWNVAGSILGVEHDLMADTMAEAEELFGTIQARALRHPAHTADARHALAEALIRVIEGHIPLRMFRPLGALVPRLLIGDRSADALRIDKHVSAGTRVAFAIAYASLAAGRLVTRLVDSSLSPTHLVGRVLAYHLMKGLMLSQTRPLRLPEECLHPLLHQWSAVPGEGGLMRWIERRMTGVPLHTFAPRS